MVPFIATVRERYPDLMLSVDTWRAEVGRLACEAGADLINDTWAGADPALAEVAAEFGVGVVCSHTGGAVPRTRPYRVRYDDLLGDVVRELRYRAQRMVDLGVPRDGILISIPRTTSARTPGTVGQLLRHRGAELMATGWPVLMALSNKDFVGETLGVELRERERGHARCDRPRCGLGCPGVSSARRRRHQADRGSGLGRTAFPVNRNTPNGAGP